MAESPANAVLQALGFALFLRDESGGLRAIGEAPPWLKDLWPTFGPSDGRLDSGVSPFLENFLIDAEESWRKQDPRASSGPWVEQDAKGDSVQLEARALTIEGQAVLLLERLGEAFETKKAMLQKARENVIAYQRLNSEIQKKEILLHCVAEDMTAALANVVTSLRLLELENNSPKSRQLLGLAARATQEQQSLIHKVLAVFADELGELFGQNGDAETDADLYLAIQRATEAVGSEIEEKKIRLTSPTATTGQMKVPLAPRQLERVLVNLIENACDHFVRGGEITMAVEDAGGAVVLKVDDNGAPVSAHACDDLFSKLEPATAFGTAPALRLHFCRMMVEGCGGEIGCGGRPGGNRFWIRLPKVTR